MHLRPSMNNTRLLQYYMYYSRSSTVSHAHENFTLPSRQLVLELWCHGSAKDGFGGVARGDGNGGTNSGADTEHDCSSKLRSAMTGCGILWSGISRASRCIQDGFCNSLD